MSKLTQLAHDGDGTRPQAPDMEPGCPFAFYHVAHPSTIMSISSLKNITLVEINYTYNIYLFCFSEIFYRLYFLAYYLKNLNHEIFFLALYYFSQVIIQKMKSTWVKF